MDISTSFTVFLLVHPQLRRRVLIFAVLISNFDGVPLCYPPACRIELSSLLSASQRGNRRVRQTNHTCKSTTLFACVVLCVLFEIRVALSHVCVVRCCRKVWVSWPTMISKFSYVSPHFLAVFFGVEL